MDNLEKIKLKLEIRELHKPWIYKIEFWKAFFPVIAVGLTIWFTYETGILDAQKETLTASKAILEYEIISFKTEKDSLQISISELNQINDSLNENIGLMKNELIENKIQLDTLYKLIRASENILELTELQKLELERESKSLADMYKFESSQNIAAQSKIQLLNDKINHHKNVIEHYISFIKDISRKITFTKKDSLRLDYINQGYGNGKFSLLMGQYIGTLQLEEDLSKEK